MQPWKRWLLWVFRRREYARLYPSSQRRSSGGAGWALVLVCLAAIIVSLVALPMVASRPAGTGSPGGAGAVISGTMGTGTPSGTAAASTPASTLVNEPTATPSATASPPETERPGGWSSAPDDSVLVGVGGIWDRLGLPLGELRSGEREYVKVRVTHYWPPWGGSNCYSYFNGYCMSSLSAGTPWEVVEGIAAACPMDWEIGSAIVLNGRMFICLDRGRMRCHEDYCEVDILTELNADGDFWALHYY